MKAGMFLGRGLVVNETGGHVGGKDLYAGNVVKINSHTFYITDADEFTLSFMEKHADEVGLLITYSFESFRATDILYLVLLVD